MTMPAAGANSMLAEMISAQSFNVFSKSFSHQRGRRIGEECDPFKIGKGHKARPRLLPEPRVNEDRN
jgi:hypothetical protein